MASTDEESPPEESSSEQFADQFDLSYWESTDSGKSDFSEYTQRETRLLSGGRTCWGCEWDQRRTNVCPVIQSGSFQNYEWEKAGLYNDFQYESTDNAIILCNNCYEEFNRFDDLGFVFFPTDLKFFIDFELADRERRRIEEDRGATIKRQVPTADEYLAHQQQSGEASSDATCGLYKRVYLNETYFFCLCSNSVGSIIKPKGWHGNPMATMRRAIATLGSPRFHVIDAKIRHEIELLRDLYFGEPLTRFEARLREDHRLLVGTQPINQQGPDDKNEFEKTEETSKNEGEFQDKGEVQDKGEGKDE